MPPRYLQIALIFALLYLPAGAAGNTDSLLSLLDSSLVSQRQVELRLQIASELSNSDISKALQHSRKALEIAEQLDSPPLLAEVKLSIGKYYDYLGVQEEAIASLSEALEVFESLEDSLNQARALMLIGNAFWYLNQFESSLKYYNQAFGIGHALHDTTLIIRGINAKGAVYGNIGQMDSALILFREANELARVIGNQEQIIHTYFNMGDVNLYAGRIDAALGIFNDLENNYDVENHSSKHLSSLYNSITFAFILKGNLKWAKRYAAKTLDALNNYSRLPEIRDYHHNMYRIDTLAGKSDSALFHYTKYIELNDSLNNAAFKDRLGRMEIFFDLKTKEIEIERLTLDNQYKDLQIRQRKIINTGSALGMILLLTIVFILIRSAVRIREKSALLEEQKDDLERANLKISAQSMDLLDKNSELERVIFELKATQQQLVQSEKMASLGTLTAGIAHEINNPLNFISGGIGIIEESDQANKGIGEKEKVSRRRKAVKMAREGLDRTSNIVSALMTFAHRGSSTKVPGDLHEIIDNTLVFLTSKLSNDIEVNRSYALEGPVSLFPDKMHQVVMNVIDNAIFAVNLNGENQKRIDISTRKSRNKAILEIANNGPAIDKATLKQIFDPFFTTKDPGMGTGLGLSISYTLISEHNGSIKAENRDKGVSFIIEIPA